MGFIGIGGRARHLMVNEKLADHADIVALADCFFPRCEEGRALLPEPGKVNIYPSYSAMLAREKLDAVFVATTTHARVLTSIHCMQAGLDVYAEKPVALTIAEGRALVRAAQKYKRVFQAGTQQRSIPINAFASRRVREGALGKIDHVILCNFDGYQLWQPQPAQPVPAGLDWDQWCNQTELRPYHPDLQFKWAIWRDYDGGGQSWGVSGWGTHALDQAQCALGTDDTGPVEIRLAGTGAKPPVILRYANGVELRLEGAKRNHEDLGAIMVGEKGKIDIQRGRCVTEVPGLLDGAPPDTPEGPGEAVDHLANFFECMRTRKLTNAHAEAAHRATSLCILVNICRELGRTLKWDPAKEQFIDDEEANRQVARPRRKGYELPTELT